MLPVSVSDRTSIRSDRNTWTVSDTVTKNVGKHLIVAGVDIMRQYWDLATDWQALPIIAFDGSVTGHDFSDVLLGRPASFWQGGGQYQRINALQQGYYVQDQIKVQPNLTVNVGLRWEPYRPPRPASGRIGSFRPGQQSQRYPNAPVGLVFPGDAGVSDARSEWQPQLLESAPWNRMAARFSAADFDSDSCRHVHFPHRLLDLQPYGGYPAVQSCVQLSVDRGSRRNRLLQPLGELRADRRKEPVPSISDA